MHQILAYAVSIGKTAIIGLVVLGVLVFVHELGHFLMAKWNKIRVLTFSLGFGKPVIQRTVNGTDYRISAVPFGGYVRMAGEHPEDEVSGEPDEFLSKPIWRRALVALSGPAANYAFALVLLWLVFVLGVQQPLYLDKTVIGAVSDSSAAQNAGFRAGDNIVAINGKPVSSWEQVERVFQAQDHHYAVTITRRGTAMTIPLDVPSPLGASLPKQPTGGLQPCPPARIGTVLPGSAAEHAGLEKGDLVVSINGDTIVSWPHLSQITSHYDTAAGPMILRVARTDTVLTIAVTPRYSAQNRRYLMGIEMAEPAGRLVRSSPRQAIPLAFAKSWEYATMIFDVVKKLVTKQVSPKQLAGPIGIVQMSGAVALVGLVPILSFMALIGINLAVLNLLPLVITDGGLLFFLALEAIRRKPLSLKHQATINQVAIAFFIMLFLYVTFNDILRAPQIFRMLGH